MAARCEEAMEGLATPRRERLLAVASIVFVTASLLAPRGVRHIAPQLAVDAAFARQRAEGDWGRDPWGRDWYVLLCDRNQLPPPDAPVFQNNFGTPVPYVLYSRGVTRTDDEGPNHDIFPLASSSSGGILIMFAGCAGELLTALGLLLFGLALWLRCLRLEARDALVIPLMLSVPTATACIGIHWYASRLPFSACGLRDLVRPRVLPTSVTVIISAVLGCGALASGLRAQRRRMPRSC